MKIKHLFLVAAAALSLAACEQEVDYGIANIQVSENSLVFTSGVSSKTITINSTREWTAYNLPDWLACDPSEGPASLDPQTVTLTTIANPGYSRTADISFTIGIMKQYVSIYQTGDKGELDYGNGTLERPYIASAAYEYVSTLASDTEAGPVYIKGIVSAVTTTYAASGTFGNAVFYISDDGSTNGSQFYVYQTYYLGNRQWKSGDTDIKVGDEVVICGKVVNYRGNTPETVGKGASFVYSLNGETAGGAPTDYDKAEPKTVAEFIAAADQSTYYKLSGTVSGFNAQYCSFDLKDDTGTIYVYSVDNKDEWSSKISNGGKVTLAGKYLYYESKSQHEVVNAVILSFEAGSQPPAGNTKGDGSLANPFNPAAACAAVANLTWTDNATYQTVGPFYVKGKISEVGTTFEASGQYGNANFKIVDSEDGTGEFYVYQTYYLGNRQWKAGDTDVKVGDEVIVYGKLMNYRGNTPETEGKGASYIYSLNGKSEAGGGGGEGGGEAAEPTDIGTIITTADETAVSAENVIVGAVTTRGYIATDGKKHIYVYGNAAPTVSVGDVVNFSGNKTTYYGLPEITTPTTTKVSSGTAQYPEPEDITASFDKYAPAEAVYVKYSAKMFKSGNYTNFGVEGASLSGALSSPPTSYYDGMSEGDEVEIYGYYNGINTNSNLLNVIVVKIVNKTTGVTIPAEDGQEQGGGSGEAADFTSTLKWTLGETSYDDQATVNGVGGVSVLKLGTSSKVGSATIVIPAGTKAISFYGVSWKDKPASVAVKVGGSTVYTKALAANAGASGNSPYTMTVTASDKYTYTLPSVPDSDVTATLTTEGSNTRILIFGVKAEK